MLYIIDPSALALMTLKQYGIEKYFTAEHKRETERLNDFAFNIPTYLHEQYLNFDTADVKFIPLQEQMHGP